MLCSLFRTLRVCYRGVRCLQKHEWNWAFLYAHTSQSPGMGGGYQIPPPIFVTFVLCNILHQSVIKREQVRIVATHIALQLRNFFFIIIVVV